ncbi:MAG: hypothetical protein ABIV36_22620 [Sphingobium limneticum]
MSLSEMPVVGPVTAQHLRHFVSASVPPSPEIEQVETMLAKLSVALPKAKSSDIEADERIDIYWTVLKGYALPDLQAAYRVLLLTCEFFPTIAEIEAAVAPIRAKRMARANRADMLIMKHEQEWRPPQPLLTVDEAARLGRILAAPLAGDGEAQ